MSHYERRGKRRYNGYGNGYRRSNNRYAKASDRNEPSNGMMNDPTNKPFRILQRKPIETHTPSTTNPASSNANASSAAPSQNNQSPNHASSSAAKYDDIGSSNAQPDNNVAAVLQNVIADQPQDAPKVSNLGQQLLGLQKRGGRLFHYKRKDGKGAVIPIPQHHKKNYNKSIGRGKKFDKEREAALQALAQQKTTDASQPTDGEATATSVTSPSTTVVEKPPTVPIISDSAVLLSSDTLPPSGSAKEEAASPEEVTGSWRRGRGGGRFRERARRGRGRGRRGKGYKSYHNIRERAGYPDTWSDEEDYIRDPSSFRGSSRWDSRRKSKFEPPRHRQLDQRWGDKYLDNEATMGAAFGSAMLDEYGYNDEAFAMSAQKASGSLLPGSPSMEEDPMTMASPNIGPRHRHYNNKFKKLHRQLTDSPSKASAYYAHGKKHENSHHELGHTKQFDVDDLHWDNLSNEFSPNAVNMNSMNLNMSMETEKDILDRYLNLYDDANRSSKCVPFLDVRMCPHVLNEIEQQLTDCQDFLVVGVIGQQGVGKSTILSYLAGGEDTKFNGKNDVFLNQELSKLISATHTTHGIQSYISRERVIYLDCQPILSPSILFSLTNHRRRCMREKPHESISSPMETWDIEMAKHALFLSSICHLLLVVSDTIADVQTVHFLRSIYTMRQSMKINSFLRHDSSLRRKIKDLQTKINEKYDKKKSAMEMNMKLMGGDKKKKKQSGNRRKQRSQVHGKYHWRKSGNDDDDEEEEEEEYEDEDESLFTGLDASEEEDYRLFQLLNAQQRYGFPDIVFVQNKVSTFDMTPSTFNFQRQFLYTMFKHCYITRQGEVGNVDLLGMKARNFSAKRNNIENEASLIIPTQMMGNEAQSNNTKKTKQNEVDEENSSNTDEDDVDEMAAKINCFFLPRVQSNRREFESACVELRNQIMSMAKPQTVSQSHSCKQTERDWFVFAKKAWHIIVNARNFHEYRGTHTRANT